jgi:hypothetical protein
MKKYLVLSFLFLLVSTPILAKTSVGAQNQQNKTETVNSQPSNSNQAVATVTPTGSQVKNQNQVKTQNQGEDQNLSVNTQESEQLNQTVDEDVAKVSDQVKELIETVGAKSGIGQQVKEIAQNQQKNQEKIKSAYYELKNRGQLIRLFVGSDKKMTQALELMNEENRLTIEKLEGMKNLTNNQTELDQLQDTIGILLTQNGYLEEKIATEKQANGLFGWFTRLFTRE